MKDKKILIASIVTVIILVISYTVSYYKTLADEHQSTLKRNAMFEYLKENNNTIMSLIITVSTSLISLLALSNSIIEEDREMGKR